MTIDNEQKNRLVELPFPKATLKRVMSRHKLQKNTRISEESLVIINNFLDELSGWIIRESEQLALNEGKNTIKAKHINQAIQIYFGKEK